MAWFNNNFKFCTPLTTADQVTKFKAYLNDLWTNIAMMNYPYGQIFLWIYLKMTRLTHILSPKPKFFAKYPKNTPLSQAKTIVTTIFTLAKAFSQNDNF